MRPVESEPLEYLYTMYYTALDAVAQYTWMYAFPHSPEDEPEGLKQARELVNRYDLLIKHRLQEIKDSVATPLSRPR